MIKKFLVLFVFIFLSVPVMAGMLPSFNTQKEMNILYILKTPDRVNFFAVRYDSFDKFIKVCFIDENISVPFSSSKNKKLKSLKDIFFEIEDAKRISIAKTEIEKIFNNNIKFDYYIFFDDKFLNKVVTIFSKEKNLQKNTEMLSVIYSGSDRYNADLAAIKILNGIYGNINRWNIISLLKSFYKKDFVLRTNFRLKDLLLSYASILDENKTFKYADVPVITKRDVLRVDSVGVAKIIDFFLNDKYKYDNENLRIEILNTTNKSRLAIKAVNKLRENGFDVFDWGAGSKKYNFTIIFDFADNYGKAAEIKKILNCGEIVFKPEERDYTDISVQLGEDCNIYDKLDRNGNL